MKIPLHKIKPLHLRVLAVLSILSALAAAPNDEPPITIIKPTASATAHSVTLTGYFWNLHLADWLDVCLCGRASDFLHETILAIPTTKSLLLSSLRDAGLHDGDYWASDVYNFTRLRGDQFLILLTFTTNNTPDTYSLDELISFHGWNAPVGPYGFMFKGDPERNLSTTKPTTTPLDDNLTSDASTILHDDPQIALTFAGIQHQSQSFADHPLAYDHWIYPALKFARNYSLLPASVYDSNGKITISVTFQKVTEQELLTLSAKYAHDKNYATYILKQLPLAQQIDNDKQILSAGPPFPQDKRLITNRIAANYAQLDLAWTRWSVDHLSIATQIPEDRAIITKQAKRWLRHMESVAAKLQNIATAEEVAAQISSSADGNTAPDPQFVRKQGLARAAASDAENSELLDYWQDQQAKIDPADDPRSDWITGVNANLELALATQERNAAFRQLFNTDPKDPALPRNQSRAKIAINRFEIATVKLQLVNLNFEIVRHTPTDAALPKLLREKSDLEKDLAKLQPATQPATAP